MISAHKWAAEPHLISMMTRSFIGRLQSIFYQMAYPNLASKDIFTMTSGEELCVASPPVLPLPSLAIAICSYWDFDYR